uniref:Uncharacterized protein n=1 Tax=Strix occidentalis caurina TaxID=311401 RepID=A0A8D0FFG2_STROC
MLTSYTAPKQWASKFLQGRVVFSHPRLSNNRSVMPLHVQDRICAMLAGSACACPPPAGVGNPLNPIHGGDWGLQFLPMNEEFPSLPCPSARSPATLPYSGLPVLKGGYRKVGEGLLIRGCRDRTRGKGFKLKEGRFR